MKCECNHSNMDHYRDYGSCIKLGCSCHTFTPVLVDLLPSAPPSVPAGAEDAKLLSDGRRSVLYTTIFGGRFLIGPADDDVGGDEEYMFAGLPEAREAFYEWDGYGEPENWVRHTVGDQVRRKYSDGRVAVYSMRDGERIDPST